MKCDLCGTESEFDAAFVQRPASLTRRKKNICPACWTRRTHRKGFRFIAFMPAALATGLVLKSVFPGGFWGEFLLNIGLIQLFLIFSVIPHEAGHAVTARALGWRVYQVTIGLGRQLWKKRWRGMLLDFRALPIAGGTFMAPSNTRLFRTKLFLSILAGPLVNACMAATVILLFGGSVAPLDMSSLPTAAHLFVFANFSILVVNLWPFSSSTGMALATDGKRLLQLLSFRKKALDEVHAIRFTHEALLCREQGDAEGARAWCEKGLALHPEQTPLLTMRGIIDLDQGNYAAARAAFLKLLEKEKKHSSTRCLMLNNIAYANALSGDPALLAEADAYSRDSYTMLPWVSAIAGTRGTVLVAVGKYQEGLQLLKKSMEDSDSARNKSENACHMVIALSKMGAHEEAAKYLRLAKELDPHCPLLRKAEQAVERELSKI